VKIIALIFLLHAAAPGRSDWIALARGGFAVRPERTALDLLAEMNPLLAADDLGPRSQSAEVQGFFGRMLEYFDRERDLRGFDPVHGWMHTVAHTSDTLKFLARNPKVAAGADIRLPAAVRAKIESHPAVFTWDKNDRGALALHAAVRRPDASTAALTAWTASWVKAHQDLWANGQSTCAGSPASKTPGR
jgi:hypothetical protein